MHYRIVYINYFCFHSLKAVIELDDAAVHTVTQHLSWFYRKTIALTSLESIDLKPFFYLLEASQIKIDE